jgi:DNA-binding MarR family transcriptional regulator
MKEFSRKPDPARMEIANRLFFKLYQCANLLHKTGTRAVEGEGLTTQQWAVLGALSRPEARQGMSVGDLARYLLLSRQNVNGVLGRLERDGRIRIEPDLQDRRSRVIRMTDAGRRVWAEDAQPKIHQYYQDALEGFSIDDLMHSSHYLIKLLDNMQRLDQVADEEHPSTVETP